MNYAIEVKDLTKTYSDFTLDHVSFKLPEGCIMGFIGENGAGKSTTIKLLLDLVSRDSGEVFVLGKEAKNFPSSLREEIGVVMDESCFPENLKPQEIDKILAAMYKTWNSDRFLAYLKRFSLPLKKQVKDFSKGMKMKLSIAVALSHASRLLILDEATGGLDPIVRDEILDVFLEFIEDERHSIFISSHILSDLEKICDYITFIHKGKLILCEEKDRLLEEYALIQCPADEAKRIEASSIFGKRHSSFGIKALVKKSSIPKGCIADPVSIEDIMIFLAKEEK